MKKKIAILATNGYEDLELHYPRIRLHEGGFETELVSLSEDIIKGKHGYPIKPDLTINEVDVNNYSGLVLPGGSSNPDHLRRHKKVLDFVVEFNNQEKLIAAICHAGWVLISAKILEGKKATSFFAIKDDMINAGVEFYDDAVIIDGNLITSRSPDDLPDFMTAILRYLNE
ncbi:MAG: DJ-1/PfpI/YhbO family deglycase/protease [Candidatus Lokiarchaeota archaeon]|nr:DJ-1/PfpI/YhbO family deglycase/protease [Candidatus Lokiarchaeota archaeon]MBD3200893.1 DJ-1/PfpI/YhbO family deglycase/protease [Candidatus Lokiarchaeota archaeon]